ncbi:UDP-glucose:glycoprotein glucosyltransferase 1-like [Corticium candelabrum]|uniref:UDP-glucose:glycoprotein glucosyltransferase 1-like n=1 Tax=Corticium candelabrum TaxID=121492 RepID=UPI002E25221F|nr:UDP-glucose:glycoprotein glucosyltransferase 1-like [Corticium candelabrum]
MNGGRFCLPQATTSLVKRPHVGILSRALVLLTWIAAIHASQKPITTVLDAKWPSTPLLLEASEFFASDGNDMFWAFVEAVHTRHHLNDRDQYNLSIAFASERLSQLKQDLLAFSLSLRLNSPKIEMFRQVAEEKSKDANINNCNAFAEIGSITTCSLQTLQQHLSSDKPNADESVKNYEFDHHYPAVSTSGITVVVYGQLGTPEFSQFHTLCCEAAKIGKIQYVMRHHVPVPSKSKTRLSGYGVELAIKSTEYKAMDDSEIKEDMAAGKVTQTETEDEVEGFLFKRLRELYAGHIEDLTKFKQHLIESTKEMAPLKAWQVQDIGFQATQRVMMSPVLDALRVLRDLSQNIPMKAKSVTKTAVESNLRKEIVSNQRLLASVGVEPGNNVFLLNGLVIWLEHTDAFVLFNLLQDEATFMDGLSSLRIPSETISKLLSLNLEQTHDSFGVDLRGDAVKYVNNLETDSRYNGWFRSVNDLFRHIFPGQLRRIAKNMFHTIFCVDLGKRESVTLLQTAQLFVQQSVPVRVGLLVVSDPYNTNEGEESVSVVLARAFGYIMKNKNAEEALNWVVDEVYDQLPDDDSDVPVSIVLEAFQSSYGDKLADKFLGPGSVFNAFRQESNKFYLDSGIRSLPQIVLNGVLLNMKEDIEQAVVVEVQEQTQLLQQEVYMGRVTDWTNLEDFFTTQPNVFKRYNSEIFSQKNERIDMSYSTAVVSSDGMSFMGLIGRQQTAILSQKLKYLSNPAEEFSTKSVTVWLVMDITSDEGRKLILNAFEHVEQSSEMRLALIPNVPSSSDPIVAQTVLAVLDTYSESKALRFLKAFLSDGHDAQKARKSKESMLEFAKSTKIINADRLSAAVDDTLNWLPAYQQYCTKVLSLEASQLAVVSNGRVLGPFNSSNDFRAADFALLEHFELKYYGTSVHSLLEDVVIPELDPDEDTSQFRSDLIMKVASLLLSKPARRRTKIPVLQEAHSCVHVESRNMTEGSKYEMSVLIDPLSQGAQKMSSMLMVLQNVTSIDLKLYMNPVEKLSDMPVSRFYRYVLEPSLQFAEDGSLDGGPAAVFADLPETPLLTLNMDVPRAWMVESVRCVYDLDNIHLGDVEQGVYAEFELEHLLIEGQCSDFNTGQPTRGVQLVLSTKHKPEQYDTLVMANLGYFQLKARPGAWSLRLRGRSAEIYDVATHDGMDPNFNEGMVLTLDSFSGKVAQIRLSKRPGKEHLNVIAGDEIEDELEEESIWESITSYVGGPSKKPEPVDDSDSTPDDTINIFSLASGHLYERFLRIMMLSVLKHTNSPVKFWFLKNYLSSTFKAFLPVMAREYNFQYSLVQYKWPRWLVRQTEKQRLIWGYKILFLDVLFPLNVKKIIFVDADQIVRTDLKELIDLDLKGAPYGYTPFCDDRKEMDGFRFWNAGYWKGHLAGRKYHISALYVVDLQRFRQVAAGDKLRGQYQGLANDPNSLANLDQDLPNNMIHQVSIFSLPQEWLWCETWCSNESKAKAKTIDLCNNPLTKEPKLKAAVRIVDEWKDYDNEIRRLQERVAANESQDHSQGHVHQEL